MLEHRHAAGTGPVAFSVVEEKTLPSPELGCVVAGWIPTSRCANAIGRALGEIGDMSAAIAVNETLARKKNDLRSGVET